MMGLNFGGYPMMFRMAVVGEAPTDERMTTELSMISASLKNLRDTHERTGEALDRLEEQIERLARAARSQAEEAAGSS